MALDTLKQQRQQAIAADAGMGEELLNAACECTAKIYIVAEQSLLQRLRGDC
jgi:hypothetical protein